LRNPQPSGHYRQGESPNDSLCWARTTPAVNSEHNQIKEGEIRLLLLPEGFSPFQQIDSAVLLAFNWDSFWKGNNILDSKSVWDL
jgi:hypothetical protein